MLVNFDVLNGNRVKRIESCSLLECENIPALYSIKMFAPELFKKPKMQFVHIFTVKLNGIDSDVLFIKCENYRHTIVTYRHAVMKLDDFQLSVFMDLYG